MTRKEAIETACMSLVELNKRPGEYPVLAFEETLITILIALGVLVVEDEKNDRSK
jgi:hypothetical protein